MPNHYNITYLISGEMPEEAKHVNKNVTSFSIAAIGSFSSEIAQVYMLQRANRVIFLSHTEDEDIEVILNAAILANYTRHTMPMIVVLHSSSFEELAQTMLQSKTYKDSVIVNISTLVSNLITVSAIYDGFGCFICNSMADKFIGLNKWEINDNNTTI